MKLICALLVIWSIGMSFVVNAVSMNTLSSLLQNREQNFQSFVTAELEPFWQQQVMESSFTNKQKLTINYAYTIPSEAKQLVVVSPGRVEGYLKYKELMYDLVQLGYGVAVIDHQGQGLSSRRLDNPHKGYVEDFNDYVVDLHQLIEQEIKPKFAGELYFLSHSMGGAIGLRYVQQYPDTFVKAVFSSPMWGLDAGPLPKSIAKGVVSSITWANNLFNDQSAYFVGGQDYNATSFDKNVLTQSPARYQFFRDTYEQEPKLKLGSITFNWLDQSVKAIDLAYEQLDTVKLPIMVMQSGNDKVIDNAGQDLFCQKLAELGNPCLTGKPIVFDGARHELLIEQDPLRNRALEKIVRFYNSNS